ncbi:MAG: hypothetical protein WB561_18410 [Terracidiphilus sp.]
MPVIDYLAPTDLYEYILVVIRKNQVQELLPVLAQNRSPSVVFMLNTASGHEDWVAALGEQRILLGFVFAGGRREGSLIRAMRSRGGSTPFGEIDGRTTDRLTTLVRILNRAGLRTKAIANMPDWLSTHAAMVVPLAMLVLKHGCDIRALAHSREDLNLLAAATRETLCVLRSVGSRVVPRSVAILGVLPRFIVVHLFRALMSSRIGEIGAGWQCSQAPDEMFQLARELKALVERSGCPAPALNRLLESV